MIVGLAVLVLSDDEVGEKGNARKGSEIRGRWGGHEKRDYDLMGREVQGGERCEFKGGGIHTTERELEKLPKSGNPYYYHSLQRKPFPKTLLHYTPLHTPSAKQKTLKPITMPESTKIMMSNLARILAIQCPLPGQPGAPAFDGKDVSVFLCNWERFTGKYRFSDERKIADLADYCSANISTYVETLVKVAKAEIPTTTMAPADPAISATGNNGGVAEGTGTEDKVLWDSLHKLLLAKFRKEDSEQQRVAVPFLRALVKEKGSRADAEDVECYVFQFQEISTTLVNDGMLTRFDQVVLFLQGLPEGMAAKIYTLAKFDVDDPSSFVKSRCFMGVVETALTMNRTTSGIDRLQTLGFDHRKTPIKTVRQILVRDRPNGKAENPSSTTPAVNPIPADSTTLWGERMAGIRKGLQELKLFQQTASANLPSGGYASGYQSINPSAPCGHLYHPPKGRSTGIVMSGANQTGGVMPGPVNFSSCRWCGLEGHLKYQCADYGKCLSEGLVHFFDRADQKTRLGLMGTGGVMVLLPESSGMWQKVWVEEERKQRELQMAGGPGEENGGGTAVVRQLSVRDVRETAGEGDPASLVSTLTLQPGEVRELVAVVNEHGAVQGWVEAKRTADDMEDTIVVNTSGRL
jgi:hypothetical protein